MPIHSMAVVDAKAEIHPDAVIGPFCCISGPVTIAAGAELRSHVTVSGRTTIGKGAILYPGCVVGSDPQDLKFRGEDSETHIGEGARIHEFVTISKGTAGGGMKTVVGPHCLIMAYAHIAHDCRLGERVVVGNSAQLAGHITVGRKATISGMVGVHHFVTIGELAFVGAMSGVRFDVPPYVTVEGYPAEPRRINQEGLRRDGMDDEDIRKLKDAFRVIFRDRSEATLEEAVSRVLVDESFADSASAQTLCRWLAENLKTSVNGRQLESLRSSATRVRSPRPGAGATRTAAAALAPATDRASANGEQ